ncbi:hypothetical protein G7046_g417 [Stylonectria norvegica]|nr:hypothetical protein G7046_g417 [Stylonectria norvegica]
MLFCKQQCLALALAALPLAYGKTFSHRSKPPPGWHVESPSPSSTENYQTFSIALTMANIDQLETQLLELSTPGNSKYGEWMSDSEVQTMFAPSAKAVSSVTRWLKSNGVKHCKVNGAFIDFAVDVSGVNSLLNADYQFYAKNGTTKLRTLSYSIPDYVSEYIQYVDPSTYFGNPPAIAPINPTSRTTPSAKEDSPTKRSVDASCQTSITPACLKQMYKIDNYKPKANSGSSVGFGSFLNQSALYADVFQFEDMNGIARQNFSTVLIDGATNDQDPATAQIGEANLDAENIVGIAHPLPFTEFIIGGSPPFLPNIDQPSVSDNQNEPYVPFLRYLLSQKRGSLPWVISTSYGDEEDGVPQAYATLACNMIGLMGLRGVTMIFSSGDLGVGAGCLAPNYNTVEFNAIFPATCPYLTSVGGTVNVAPEIAWDGSSGGFSKYFSRPNYQDEAIGAYMKTVSAKTKEYYGRYTNWNGRGFPDVAAHSVSPDYQVIYAGKPSPSGGTSAAAPVWGAIVGLLNDARFRAGKSSLGWLNPLIYKHGPEVLTDITGGYSVGCNGQNTQSGGPEPAGSGIVLGARWNATAGWDPTTGYGTPNFQKLKNLVLEL